MRPGCHGILGEKAGPRNKESCILGLDLPFTCVSSDEAPVTTEPIT